MNLFQLRSIMMPAALMAACFCGARIAQAQNLVANPSFEDYTLCPDNQAQIDRAVGWQTCRGTSDFLHACGAPGVTGVPDNMMGWHQAGKGSGYAHVICFSEDDGNPLYSREWIGRYLSEPMQIGTTYYVSVKFSWTTTMDSIIGSIRFANDHLGVLFRMEAFLSNDALPVPNFAHVWTNQMITDSIEWTVVSGSFVADSAYTFISVGNFFDDIVTNAVEIDPGGMWPLSHYYVDDVCVSMYPQDCEIADGLSERRRSQLVISPNPAEDHFIVGIPMGRSSDLDITLIDPLGQPIDVQMTPLGEGKVLVHWSECVAPGPYVVRLTIGTGQPLTNTLMIQHP